MKNKLIYLVAYLILLEAGSYCFLRFFTNYDLRSRPLEIFNTESPILSFGVKKNFSQRFVRREFDVRVKTNNIGLRENEPYNGEKIDIAFAGDSFVFGHGVNAGERFSDLLRPHFPGKNILSLAYLNGWTAPHYYLFLKYNPQWVPELLIMELYLGCDLRSDIEETNFVFDTNNQLLSAKSLRRFVDSRGMFTADHGWFYRLADSIFTGKAVLVGYGILKK
ncbi:MAG: hypothetical protein VYC17_05430, partial [Nitrospinota bacterium]|nr:hypothetical protein [Nitrospinota bacterium]